jgi:hypothetical protein
MRSTSKVEAQWKFKFPLEPCANSIPPALTLEDKLRGRLRQPPNKEDDYWITRVADLARAMGSVDDNMLEALKKIRVIFGKVRAWRKALEDIAAEAHKSDRNLRLLLEPQKGVKKKGSGRASGCSQDVFGHDPVSEEVMASAVEILGRQIQCIAETDKEFTERSLRAARKRFSPENKKSRQAAVRHLIALAKGLDIPLSDLADENN